jgi:hypothetical protein
MLCLMLHTEIFSGHFSEGPKSTPEQPTSTSSVPLQSQQTGLLHSPDLIPIKGAWEELSDPSSVASALPIGENLAASSAKIVSKSEGLNLASPAMNPVRSPFYSYHSE